MRLDVKKDIRSVESAVSVLYSKLKARDLSPPREIIKEVKQTQTHTHTQLTNFSLFNAHLEWDLAEIIKISKICFMLHSSI